MPSELEILPSQPSYCCHCCGTLYSLLKMYMKGGGGGRTPPADLKEIRDGLAAHGGRISTR